MLTSIDYLITSSAGDLVENTAEVQISISKRSRMKSSSHLLDCRSITVRRGLRFGRSPSGDDFVLGTSTTGGRTGNASERTPVVGRSVGVLSFLNAFDGSSHR